MFDDGKILAIAVILWDLAMIMIFVIRRCF